MWQRGSNTWRGGLPVVIIEPLSKRHPVYIYSVVSQGKYTPPTSESMLILSLSLLVPSLLAKTISRNCNPTDFPYTDIAAKQSQLPLNYLGGEMEDVPEFAASHSGFITVINGCEFKVSWSNLEVPENSVFTWIGWKGDDRTEFPGIRLIAENLPATTTTAHGEMIFNFMDGISFHNFDTFVLFDITHDIAVATAILPQPPTTTPPTTTPTTPPTTPTYPPNYTHNAGTGSEKPECTTTPAPYTGTAGDNDDKMYDETDSETYADKETYSETDNETNSDKDTYGDSDVPQYATSDGISLMAISSLCFATLSFCLFI
jgi:hypothetical protein